MASPSREAPAPRAPGRFAPGAFRHVAASLLLLLPPPLLSAGCARPVTAQGTLVRPAPLPVRTHPQVFVVPGPSDAAATFAVRLAAHLEATSRSQVTFVAEAFGLERRRRQGEFPPASAVLYIGARFDETTESEWVSRPHTVCGPINCYSTRRSVLEDTAVLTATVQLQVFEGPTARPLGEEALSVRLEGRNHLVLREEAIRRLEARLADTVDARRVLVPVELPPFPGGDEALARIEAGDWAAGRALLEARIDAPDFAGLDEGNRARVWYALGQARRFDPATARAPDEGFAAAAAAFERATDLAPDEERFRRAQADLEQHRALLRAYEGQREIARRNFTYAEQLEALPEPPENYRVQPPTE